MYSFHMHLKILSTNFRYIKNMHRSFFILILDIPPSHQRFLIVCQFWSIKEYFLKYYDDNINSCTRSQNDCMLFLCINLIHKFHWCIVFYCWNSCCYWWHLIWDNIKISYYLWVHAGMTVILSFCRWLFSDLLQTGSWALRPSHQQQGFLSVMYVDFTVLLWCVDVYGWIYVKSKYKKTFIDYLLFEHI